MKNLVNDVFPVLFPNIAHDELTFWILSVECMILGVQLLILCVVIRNGRRNRRLREDAWLKASGKPVKSERKPAEKKSVNQAKASQKKTSGVPEEWRKGKIE